MSDLSLTTSVLIRVDPLTASDQYVAAQWAQDLNLPFEAEAEFALQVSADGLQLQDLSADAPGPLRVDFIEGALAHRRQFGGGSGQMIAKAVGIQPGVRPTILDATAGLGRDAFVLACLGCQVHMIERNPIVAALLADGLRRARLDAAVAVIVQRMPLLVGDAIELMSAWTAEAPQVIHLDPMFPSRDKSALVKKEMRLFKPLVGADADAPDLLVAALALATHRVVVKRPRKAPAIAGTPPTYSVDGKSSRYDVYAKKSLKP
ncbi:MAG: class I SAM-dependent methyltransferase [Pseudomonas sp.]|jgi:16S rRNA (guanine1516-N2)-methyltransferase|nr:class I SAM-dependent methyltransferase [Pseudomonas sp.]MDD2222572.1 class I SAM-dependent methyltransferase [Pseudomonas sp.]NLO52893.1 class I SAM-dependent methyltransferase [Gammaproteobacteria bacterium]